MERFWLIIGLTVVIHLVSTLAYSIRLAGVRSRSLLTAYSLYNVVYIVASVSTTIQIPLMTSMMEHGLKTVAGQTGEIVPDAQLMNQEAYRVQLLLLAERVRLVILAATLGTAAGAFLMPSFTGIFVRAIHLFEETGSLIRVMVRLGASIRPRGANPVQLFSRYGALMQLAVRNRSIAKSFLLANIVVTGLYTTGIVSALYAGALFPEFRSTAASLSAVVNGLASVLGSIVVEPAASSIADESLRGEREEADVVQMTFCLVATRFGGTLLAQLLFLPGAYLIRLVAQLLA